MKDTEEQRGTARGLAVTAYALLTLLMLLQQPGETTYDTRAELTQRPGDFLAGAFTLWHPESNFGEFQNQAYGYLFPQGTWFWLNDLLGVPDWVGQRLWSALVLVVAWEGARRVARAVGVADLPALLAGAVYALSPRLLGTVGVQTAESLPGAVMPWLVLAVVLHLRGRLGARSAALMSGAAVVCMGGVNAVETAGSLPLAAILVLWGARRGLAERRFVLGWGAAVAAGCLWWAVPLAVLARYAPPFYEYVESAGDTTSLVGWSESVRGDSSWLGYLLSGDQPWWPAAFHLATEPLLVVVAAVVAAIGLVGLTRIESDLRRPLLLAVLLGLGCLTVAHGGPAGSFLADPVRSLLDGPLQIFRNVHKIDPVVRLPLAIGFATAVALAAQELVRRRPRLETAHRGLLVLPLLLVAVLGQPLVLNQSRTTGWEEIAEPWQQAKAFLADQHAGRVLVVPGSSFALQDWGWTIDEPLAILGGTDVVSRTQVPLVPGETIRYLSALDQTIATGRATEALADELARAGVTHVVLRRDLLRQQTRSPHPGGAAVSLARAGLQRLAGFGETADGAATVEVFAVPHREDRLRTTDADDVLTVRGTPESVLALQATGVLDPARATVLEGEPGWDPPADVVTDANQRRERAFGNNDEALSALMGADDGFRVERAVHDFPAGPSGHPVVAGYDGGLDRVSASSAQGYADNYGAVTVESGPQAAVDGDLDTRWVSSGIGRADQQWLRLDLTEPERVHEVTVTPVADDRLVVPIREIEVVAGRQRVRAKVGADGVPVVVPLDGSAVDRVEVRVVSAATDARAARVGLREVRIDDLRPTRTYVLPGTAPDDAALVFSAVPGRRACSITLGRPDCDVARIRGAEERGGLDRSFVTDAAARVRITGHVVARSTPEAALLLAPFSNRLPVGATSSFGQDPKVAGRFAHDGEPSTTWVSDDTDLYPTLSFRWPEPTTITGLRVPTAGVDGAPVSAVVTGDDRDDQVVTLDTDDTIELAKPVTTRALTVRFEKAAGWSHVVVPEIALEGADVTQPFLADAPTGAVCGFGPEVVVDGRRLATRVTGTMADIANGSPMALEVCDADGTGEPVATDLGAGEHRLAVVPNAEMEALDLAVVPDDTVAAPGPGRAVEIEQWGSSRRTAQVAAGPATVLSVPENFNDGWVAEADGRRLEPLRVDGWQQGWVLPAGGAVEVELRYAPERTYDVVLPVGLAVSGGVLLAGLAALVLTLLHRRRYDAEQVAWPDAEPWTGRLWLVTGVGVTLLLGPVAAAGVVAGSLLRRPVGLPAAAGALLVASGVLDAWTSASVVADLADLSAAVAVGLVAGLALGPPSWSRTRTKSRKVAS
jgi:arabinofuranan 3-O-arabinosyltransferase